MFFLAGLLNRSSLSFIFVSIVRLISIVAILFMLAMEIYLIAINVKTVHKSSPSDDPAGSGNHDSGSTKQALNQTDILSLSEISASTSCGYINGTNVPTTFGGILFFVLGQICNMIILILCLLSELSFPPLPQLFQNFFPPLGQSFGVGILGGLEVYIACTLLSHHINTTSRASAWMLFIIGLINILLGFIFGRRIRSKRSLLDASTAYVKKTAHVDDIQTGIKITQAGAKKGRSVFKKLRPSMISRPQETEEVRPWDTTAGGSMNSMTTHDRDRPLEVSKPIIDYIQHRRDAAATLESSNRSAHSAPSISLPSQPFPIYSNFKTAAR